MDFFLGEMRAIRPLWRGPLLINWLVDDLGSTAGGNLASICFNVYVCLFCLVGIRGDLSLLEFLLFLGWLVH